MSWKNSLLGALAITLLLSVTMLYLIGAIILMNIAFAHIGTIGAVLVGFMAFVLILTVAFKLCDMV